ncbi:major facilitator superfamily protein [Clostridium polyendosporum]|uniref:Major facilitator superfamily protein n=1 Tax=Clostridium polyendosporum TaxID=69208 RepID=A0A919S2D2_9CLOT|nr:MFS transporter [Clostridium polyendosporum]GIM29318.1 major facilitator superfamily protein [Clostridium polyendosporum]
MKQKQKNNWVALSFIFLLMVLAAVTENTKGIFIPVFKQEFGVNDTQIGNLLILTAAAYMIMTFIGGTLSEKFGQKNVFIFGLVVIIGSLLLLSRANSFAMLVIGISLSSAGLGLNAIASNTVIPVIVLSFQTIIMNVLHFCYGLGSTLGQRVFGVLTEQGVNWRTLYIYVAIIYSLVLISFLFVKIPKPKTAEQESTMSMKEIFSDKLVVFYMLALGFYVFAEQATGNWFVNYMGKTFSYGSQKASFYVSLFFGLYAIGRLLGGFVVEKFGYFNVLKNSMLAGAALYLLGIFLGERGMIVISISGLFFSIIFPTTVLTISQVFTEKSAYITGLIVTAAMFITMILNWTIGILNDTIGVGSAFFLIPASAIISTLCLIYIDINTKSVLVTEN